MNDIDKMLSVERFLQEVCKMMIKENSSRIDISVTTNDGTVVPLYIAIAEEVEDNDR